MDKSLREFISSRQEKGEGFYTHVSQVQPVGRYNIPRSDTEEFWNLYCDFVKNNPNAICGLSERQSDYSPVLNDTDIKIKYDPIKHKTIIDNKKKLYTENHLLRVVSIYQKHLKQIIRGYQPKHGICFVLEKPHATLDDKGRICNGFHLHFINTVMNKIDQDVHLYHRVKEDVDQSSIFNDLGIPNSGETVDKTTSKAWLLYGSRKQGATQSYRVSKILDDDCNEISLQDALKEFKMYNMEGDVMDLSVNTDYYLPRILSLYPENRETVSVRTELRIISKSKLKKVNEISIKERDSTKISDELKVSSELLKLISPSRADNYNEWIDIGWTLYNIGYGTNDALDLWIEFSKQTSRDGLFSEKNCVYHWENMKLSNKSIGTLKMYAKQDSPEGYKKTQDRLINRLTNESLNGGHADMAQLLFEKYGDEYVCACIEKDIWYVYKDHRWVLNSKGIELRKKISTELVEYYKQIKKNICNKMGEEDEDDGELRKKLNTVNKIIANLKTYPFKVNIMKECSELFYNDVFYENLNTNPNLIHFKNGVLDLETMEFRNGRQTDYISMTTGYDYKEHKWDDLEVIECKDHFSKVYPDPELYNYFMEYCASLLKGGNSAKTFLIKTGEGDNGKSINIDFLKLVFGKYMRILPTSLITGQRTQSSQATPELSGIRGVRFCVLQEPNKKDGMNIGILKELTGNDLIYTRGLFKEAEEVRPMFKLCLICNGLPVLPSDDPATWDRIRVLPHESCFPKDVDRFPVPKSIEEQFKMKRFPRDPFFSEKLPKMKTAFMWMMFETYKKIKAEGRMPEPEKVRNATSIYRKNNDIFLHFILERIVVDKEDEKATMSVVETYNAFKTWFEDSYPNIKNKMPSKEDMKVDLIHKWGDLSKSHKWVGYRLRTLEDDERDGNVIVFRDEDLNKTDEVKEEKEMEVITEEKSEEKKEYHNVTIRRKRKDDKQFVPDEDEEGEEDEDENIIIARMMRK
jgi:P4 family phage/plasmid primase-like protien